MKKFVSHELKGWERGLTDDCLFARSSPFLTFTITCMRVSSVNLTGGRRGAVMPPIVELAIAENGTRSVERGSTGGRRYKGASFSLILEGSNTQEVSDHSSWLCV